jgi:transposase InsO family protein
MCQVLKVSRSAYYEWRKREKSKRQQENEKLKEMIKEEFEKSHKTYGSRRITNQIRYRGYNYSENPIARLMSEREGWLYLAVILDMLSRMAVGWSVSHRLTRDLVITALKQAIWRRRPSSGLIFHSDRGSQYASNDFKELLNTHNMIQSMSRKGNPYDNTIMESFFHTLKTELVYNEYYFTREQASQSLFDYIETFYNPERIHSSLGYLSPKAFESLIMQRAS